MSRYGIEVSTEMDVPSANMRVDFLISNFKDDTLKQHSPFKYFTPEVVGEFKSENDFFEIGDLFATIAKLHFYLASRHGYMGSTSKRMSIVPKDLCVVIIVSGHRSLPARLVQTYHFEELEKGVYRMKTTTFHSVIIILSKEIVLSSHNYFLGMFVTSRFAEFLEIAASVSDNFMLTVAHILFRDQVIKDEKAMEVLDKKGFTIKESVEALGISRVIDEVGLKRVVEEVGLKRVVEEVGLKRVVEEVGLKRVIEEFGMEKIFNEYSMKEIVTHLSEDQKDELRELLG